MFRNYIKLYNEHILKNILNKQKNIFKRTYFVPQIASESKCFPPRLLPITHNFQSLRSKSKKSREEKSESESDYEVGDFTDEIRDKNTKILEINVTSLRVDAILKSALGMARNKIETIFYDSKIRVNGKKILKKSATVRQGDEIDLVKGPDVKNPNFINVARVEILSMKGNEDSISVKIRRCKSLTIEDY